MPHSEARRRIFLAPPRLAGGAAVISIGAETVSSVPGGWRWHLHPPPSQQTPCCRAPSKFTLKPTGFQPPRTNVVGCVARACALWWVK